MSSAPDAPVFPDTDTWAALAELYRTEGGQPGVEDLSTSVYANHVARCAGTLRALRLMQGHREDEAYVLLTRCFEELQQWADSTLLSHTEPSEAEESCWFDARMDALEALGQWQVVAHVPVLTSVRPESSTSTHDQRSRCWTLRLTTAAATLLRRIAGSFLAAPARLTARLTPPRTAPPCCSSLPAAACLPAAPGGRDSSACWMRA